MPDNIGFVLDDIISGKFWLACWVILFAVIALLMAAGYGLGSLIFG